jgi:hypothetical protein
MVTPSRRPVDQEPLRAVVARMLSEPRQHSRQRLSCTRAPLNFEDPLIQPCELKQLSRISRLGKRPGPRQVAHRRFRRSGPASASASSWDDFTFRHHRKYDRFELFIVPFPICLLARSLRQGCGANARKLLVDGFTTKIACPPGASACLSTLPASMRPPRECRRAAR